MTSTERSDVDTTDAGEAGDGGRAAAPVADVDSRYPWVAMGVVLIGTFMVILDTTIVNVALPQIGKAFGTESGVDWIVTAYLLAVGVCQPATGWLADRFGRKRVFTVSLGLFTTGSLLAALSPSLGVLVGFRVVQGLGGGAMVPVGMTMIYELFPPHKRGMALGTWGIAAMAGPAFGPVIGGYLVTAVSWHWLFFVNVPIGVVGVVAARRLLRDTGYREHRRFDGFGLGIVAAGLVLWLLAFGEASSWGWSSTRTLACLAVGGVLIAAFVRHELRIEHPALDVRIFGVPIFSLTLGILALGTVAQFAAMVFLPLQLETLRGMSALRVGTMLVPLAIGGAITFPLGGRLTDKVGPRPPVIAGSLLLMGASWVLGHLTPDASTLRIEVALVVVGLGMGFAMMPNSVTGMNVLPDKFAAQAAAVRQLNVRVAASFGVAVLATLVTTRLGSLATAAPASAAAAVHAQSAYNLVFLIGVGTSIAATVLALFLPGRARTEEILRTRAAEQRELALDVA